LTLASLGVPDFTKPGIDPVGGARFVRATAENRGQSLIAFRSLLLPFKAITAPCKP
jgi:hypothetical protein